MRLKFKLLEKGSSMRVIFANSFRAFDSPFYFVRWETRGMCLENVKGE